MINDSDAYLFNSQLNTFFINGCIDVRNYFYATPPPLPPPNSPVELISD